MTEAKTKTPAPVRRLRLLDALDSVPLPEQGSMGGQNELAKEIVGTWRRELDKRKSWESRWETLTRLFLPHHTRSYSLDMGTFQWGGGGQSYSAEVLDSAPSIAAERLGSIMDSMLTPVGERWHRIVPADEGLRRNKAVMVFCDAVTSVLFGERYSYLANFQAQAQQYYQGLAVLGSGCVKLSRAAYGNGLAYSATHLGQLCPMQDASGRVDTIFDAYPLAARLWVREWGEACPREIQESALREPDKAFICLNAVGPRRNQDKRALGPRRHAFASYVISPVHEWIVEEKGYSTFPYLFGRWAQATGEVFGRGPGWTAEAATRTLYAQKKVVLEAGLQVVRPAILTRDNDVAAGFSARPGHRNAGYLDEEGRPLAVPFNTGARPDIGRDMMEDERLAIEEAFLTRLYRLLEETREMTAFEVQERMREKGVFIGPPLSRQFAEFLGPLIQREVDLCVQAGRLPDPPEQLAGQPLVYVVEYDSPLSRMQQAGAAAGSMRWLQWLTNQARDSGDPSWLDWANPDEVAPDLSVAMGVLARHVRSPEEVEELRAGRAQSAAEQREVEAAPAAAQLLTASTAAAQVTGEGLPK